MRRGRADAVSAEEADVALRDGRARHVFVKRVTHGRRSVHVSPWTGGDDPRGNCGGLPLVHLLDHVYVLLVYHPALELESRGELVGLGPPLL